MLICPAESLHQTVKMPLLALISNMKRIILAVMLLTVTTACVDTNADADTPAVTRVSGSTSSDIVFVGKSHYDFGEPIDIRIRNLSKSDTFYYQSYYPACYNLKFFDSSTASRPYPSADSNLPQHFLLPGQFIVSKGTHCDLIFEKSLSSGQEVVLLTWNQDMCIKDRWGCMESVQVGRGEYRIIGEFAQKSGIIGPNSSRESATTVAEWKFVIE